MRPAQHGLPRVLGVLSVLALASGLTPRSPAQSNSLFRQPGQPAPPRQVPSTQPAEGGPVLVPDGTGRVARATLQAPPPTDEPNALLLYNSPIAVQLPEPETMAVNDLVTIIVRVSKSAQSDAKLKSKKDWTHEWTLEDWVRVSATEGLIPQGFENGIPAVKFDYSNEYKGDGQYDRKDSLTTRLQARVIDVKPNGNLVLESRNDVKFGEEDYTVTLTGVCRSADVTPQNTVLSSQIAELNISVEDRGAVRDATRRGWLQRLHDFLRPF